MRHPNLSDAINDRLEDLPRMGGVDLTKITPGVTIKVQTVNTLYTIVKLDDEHYTIEGHTRYCPTPTRATIAGCTWGGSMLNMGWLRVGMHMEFSTPTHRAILTTPIVSIEVQ